MGNGGSGRKLVYSWSEFDIHFLQNYTVNDSKVNTVIIRVTENKNKLKEQQTYKEKKIMSV